MAALTEMIEPAVTGMGFELVEAQALNRGRLLRIFIDKPGGVTVDDCAELSRHLARVFEVERFDYDRLEVSSPGLDRPLRKAEDFERFAGEQVEVRMRAPDATGRRKFVGVLRGLKEGSAALEVQGQVLALDLATMERARLVPKV